MRVQSGKLDRRLELLAAGASKVLDGTVIDAFGQVVPDDFGQEIATFETVATFPAQRLEMRTQDAARAGGRDTYAMARYLIRWRNNISTAMRVRAGGKLYDIVAIDEPDRRATLVITLEEVTKP